MTERTDWTTDREGNEIREGHLVWVKSETRHVKGVIVAVEIYRVQVQTSEHGYLWAHVSDVTLAE